MSGATASVVIPAHNEEAVIGRCLEHLLEDAAPGELEVVVACNGCTDRTAEIARSFGPDVRVVETDVASKPAALNLGDDTATAFPRIYLDADIRLGTGATREVAQTLRNGAGAAAPRLRVDLAERSWPIRAYYRIWTRLPYVSEGLVGSGVYGLSREGRARFDRFPDTFAEDNFVRRSFAPDERVSLASCEFVLTPATSVRSLIVSKARVFAANKQGKSAFGWGEEAEPPRGNRGAILRLSPRLWPSLAAYLAIQGSAKLRARWKLAVGDVSTWERDETGREAGTAPAQSDRL